MEETMTDWSALHDAARDGLVTEVNDGDDLEARTSEGYTPMMVAVMHSHHDTVDMLLKKGAVINCRDGKNRTPLHWAAERGDIKMVHLLVNKGAHLDARASNGTSPLLLAAFQSQHDVVKLLVNQGANIYCCDKCVNIYCCNSFSDHMGLYRKWSLIHYAARYGWVEIINFLVEKDTNLNVKGANDETPLMVAIDFLKEEVVEILLNCDVDINCRDKFRYTALHHAIKSCSLQTYNLELLKLLLSKGPDIEIKGWGDQTPLMFSTALNWKEAAELFLDAGADIHCVNRDNWSMLHFAAENGWVDIAELLLKGGLDINAMTHHVNENNSVSTSSPLHVACVFYKLKMIAYLLASGANPFIENRKGYLPYSELVIEEVFPMDDVGDDGVLTPEEKPLVVVEIIKLFIEYGGYIRPAEYTKILKKEELKAGLLQDESVCTQSIINKFNSKDLLEVYKVPVFAKNLPGIEHMKLLNKSARAQEIKLSVRQEILTKGFCDVLKPQRTVLSFLALRPLVEYYEKYVKEKEVPRTELFCRCECGCLGVETFML